RSTDSKRVQPDRDGSCGVTPEQPIPNRVVGSPALWCETRVDSIPLTADDQGLFTRFPKISLDLTSFPERTSVDPPLWAHPRCPRPADPLRQRKSRTR